MTTLAQRADKLEQMGIELPADVTDFDLKAWRCKARGKNAVMQIAEQGSDPPAGMYKSQVVAAWCKELLRAQWELWTAMCAVPRRDREKFLRRWGDVRSALRAFRRSKYPVVLRVDAEYLQHDDLMRDQEVAAWVCAAADLWQMVQDRIGPEFEALTAVMTARFMEGNGVQSQQEIAKELVN